MIALVLSWWAVSIVMRLAWYAFAMWRLGKSYDSAHWIIELLLWCVMLLLSVAMYYLGKLMLFY